MPQKSSGTTQIPNPSISAPKVLSFTPNSHNQMEYFWFWKRLCVCVFIWRRAAVVGNESAFISLKSKHGSPNFWTQHILLFLNQWKSEALRGFSSISYASKMNHYGSSSVWKGLPYAPSPAIGVVSYWYRKEILIWIFCFQR